MEAIVAFILIAMFIMLMISIWREEYQPKRNIEDIVMEMFDTNEENIREAQQHFMTLIEVLYKKNEKKLEVKLSNKGSNQLEYIFNDIREQDIKNSKNAANDDKSRLEIELRIKHESDRYNQVMHAMKEQFDTRQEYMELVEEILHVHQELKRQLDEKTDLLLNGDLSEFFNTSGKLRNYQ